MTPEEGWPAIQWTHNGFYDQARLYLDLDTHREPFRFVGSAPGPVGVPGAPPPTPKQLAKAERDKRSQEINRSTWKHRGR